MDNIPTNTILWQFISTFCSSYMFRRMYVIRMEFPLCVLLSYTKIYYYLFIFSGSAAQRRVWPPRPRGFVVTHNDAPQSVGLLLEEWSARHRYLYLTRNTTNFHDPSEIRTHYRSRRAAVDLYLRPRGYWDRYKIYIYFFYAMIYTFNRSWVDTRWQQYITHLHTNSTHNTDKRKLGSAGRAPSLRVIPWHLPYNWEKSTKKTSVRIAQYKNNGQ
jgi:hypothetical protein